MATQNILLIKHEQFLKMMEDRVQNEGMDMNVQKIMHDYLAQKRKTPWTINLEKIFVLYVNVCVAVDETEVIRETLTQYKFLTQATYSSSLENVLVHIRNQVENLFKEKISAYQHEEVLQCGDIESEELEQSLLTSYLVLDEKKKEIQIKKVLRQLMEMYRIVIETSKVHKRLEEVFTGTVERVLETCQKYNRVRELKRFFDGQHTFLDQIQKREVDFSKNPNHINIFTAETRDNLIKVRLDCVESALSMGFYSHAFTQLEDISILLNLRKVTAPIKQRMLSTYYLQLSKIFWNSKYFQYHSFFLYHHILVYRTNPNATAQEIKQLVDELLLGILSIPSNSLESSQNEESRMKIAQLQKSNNKLIPRKDEIINMVLRMNLNEVASEHINTLFNLTQTEINIFNISKKVEPAFTYLRANPVLAVHVKPIEENLINRVIASISKVYKTLNVENLYKFLSFSSHATCDACLNYASATNQINCRIDQSKKVIIFNPTKAKNDYVNASANIAALAQAAQIISSSIALEDAAASAAKKTVLVQEARQYLDSSKEVLKVRNDKILLYKIKKEQSNNQETNQRDHEDKLFDEKERLRKMEEHNRKLEEKKLREQVETQQLKLKMDIRQEIIKIKGNQVAKIEGIKIENMTEEDLRPIQVETLVELRKNIQDKLKENQENKYKKAFTKMDYIERETRKAEQEKIAALAAKEPEDKLIVAVSNAKALFEQELAIKQTVATAQTFKESFFKSLLHQRQTDYEIQLKEFKNSVESQFKKNILEAAKHAYEVDQEKKREEEAKAKELQLQQLKDKINTQQIEAENADAGWRIVRDPRDVDPSGPISSEPSSFSRNRENVPSAKKDDDFWGPEKMDAPIVRGQASAASNNNPFTAPVSSEIRRGAASTTTGPAAASSAQSESDAWRTTTVKAVVKPAESTVPNKFTNSRQIGGGSNFMNNNNSGSSYGGVQSTGNPNEVRKGFGGSSSSNSFTNNSGGGMNRPQFQGKPAGSTNPNPNPNPNIAPATQAPAGMSRGNAPASRPTDSKPTGGSSWRK